MPEPSDINVDILIAGAGFAGSLAALALHDSGFKICLVEKGKHPRFAIGESSTPVADMMLRRLSSTYNLSWLHDFSRYGSWQRSHREVVCGLKRGFSFFKHYPGQQFTTDAFHKNELLVAASADDIQSDTNWLRADIDAFFANKVKESGIAYYELTEIISATENSLWEFNTIHAGKPMTIRASFFIDATGSGNTLEKLFGVKSSADDFLTDSFAIFSHFNDVARWTGFLKKENIPVDDFPYDPDDSALHQVLDEGWLWMLRFNDRRTSLGFALDSKHESFKGLEAEQVWNNVLQKYPAINTIISSGTLATRPGKIVRSGRLQRKTDHGFGRGWVALPHTIGFVDPLFSSGIAQSLWGLEKILVILNQHWTNKDALYENLKNYQHAVGEELKLIDMLVAGCYKTMPHFELFNTWSMLYFAATITCEQQLLQNKLPGYYLGADNDYIREIVKKSYRDLLTIINQPQPSPQNMQWFSDIVKERIKPINSVGLMDPSLKNMYHHTAAIL